MSEEFIDPKKRSPRELMLQILDKVEDLEIKVEKYIVEEAKMNRAEVSELKIRLAVIETKAAMYGLLAGAVISGIFQWIIK